MLKGRDRFRKVHESDKRGLRLVSFESKDPTKPIYIRVPPEEAVLLENGDKEAMDRVLDKYLTMKKKPRLQGKYYKPFFPF